MKIKITIVDSHNVRILSTFTLILALALITFPRFNNQDLGPIKYFVGTVNGKPSLGDAQHYVKYVNYFRSHEGVTNPVPPPFSYRPAVPLIASVIPLANPMTSLNVVNLLSLYIALLFLYKLLRFMNFNYWYSLIGCFMFSISFPTFYYGTIGYIDPALVCCVIAGTYFIFREKWLPVALIIMVGSAVKETIIILIPIAFIYLIKGKKPWKFIIANLSIAYLVSSYLIRSVLIKSPNYFWSPGFEIFQTNLRIKALLSVVFSIGIPGLLTVLFFSNYYKGKDDIKPQCFYAVLIGLLLSTLLIVFSLFAAYTDGRFCWLFEIYAIPLSLCCIKELKIINIESPPARWAINFIKADRG